MGRRSIGFHQDEGGAIGAHGTTVDPLHS